MLFFTILFFFFNSKRKGRKKKTRNIAYLSSLLMLSPNPGVSTIVKEIRVPSSSSSSSNELTSVSMNMFCRVRSMGIA